MEHPRAGGLSRGCKFVFGCKGKLGTQGTVSLRALAEVHPAARRLTFSHVIPREARVARLSAVKLGEVSRRAAKA